MLGGDVHCSYTAVAALTDVEHPGTAIHQLTMSPFRNDIERVAKGAFKLFNRKGATAGDASPRPARQGRRRRHELDRRARRVVRQRRHVDRRSPGRGAARPSTRRIVDGERQVLRHTLDVELAPGTPSPDSSIDEATATV